MGTALFVLSLGVTVYGSVWLVGAAIELLPSKVRQKLDDIVEKF